MRLALARRTGPPRRGLKLWLDANRIQTAETRLDDNFNRADAAVLGNASGVGGAWTAHLGTFGIATNKANLQTVDSPALATLDSGAANGVLDCDLPLSSGIARVDTGLGCRAVDQDNLLAIRLRIDTTSNVIEIVKRADGVATSLASLSAAGLVEGTTYAVKVLMRGNQLSVYVDGVHKLSYTLTAAEQTTYGARTLHGLTSRRGALLDDGGSRWENFRFHAGYEDGDIVETWKDRSGQGFDPVQATATKRPLYKTAIRNGLPVLRFDGADDAMSFAAAANGISRNVAGLTWFLVFAADVANIAQRVLVFPTGSGGTRAEMIMDALGNTGVGGRRLDADAYQSTAGGTYAAATWNLWTAVMDHANRTVRLFKDGSEVAISTTFQAAGHTEDTQGTNQSLGAGLGGGASNFDGDTAETVVYNRALITTERRKVERYLARKWGVTLAA